MTAKDALVLSPYRLPDSPAQLPDVFDAFARAIVGIETNQLVGTWSAAGEFLIGHRESPEPPLRAMFVTQEGHATKLPVEPAWPGRVDRDLLSGYLRSEWRYSSREPSWGAQLPLAASSDRQRIEIVNPALRPLVDPLRETAAPDDERHVPLGIQRDLPWTGVLTSWELTDAYLARNSPGSAWIAQRKRDVVSPNGRYWWELRGERESGDRDRFRGEWSKPRAVIAYLGWHAYFVDAAGPLRICPACGRDVPQGRRYCGASDCDRARAAQRQRESRSGKTPG